MGLDLLDFFRGVHSWRKLATLVRQLPSSSHTTEAMANDDELAESFSDQEPSKSSGPKLSEYTAEVARLDAILDRLTELIATTVRMNGGKAPRTRPATRPETAFTRAQQRRADKKMSALIAEVEEAQQRAAATNT
jgi:hypothetical protein